MTATAAIRPRPLPASLAIERRPAAAAAAGGLLGHPVGLQPPGPRRLRRVLGPGMSPHAARRTPTLKTDPGP